VWTPTSEAEIQLAIGEGGLAESVSLDVKRSTGHRDSERRDTAKDLAAFGLFGGALLIGVSEDKPPTGGPSTFSLCPQPLQGLAEKLEQIAANLVSPPLYVRVREILSETDPSVGYLFVEIPPSGLGPHMVQGRYYARGEKTNRVLADAEVVRLHAQRRSGSDFLFGILNEEVSRDPFPEERREQGHLFVIAEPLQAADDEMLLGIVRVGNNTPMLKLINSAEDQLRGKIPGWEPSPSSVSHWRNRARGYAATTFDGGLRKPGQSQAEKYALDIEIQEHGGIRVFCGRLTDDLGQQGQSHKVLADGLALAYAVRVVKWAEKIAKATGYRGSWGFGIACVGIEGLESYESTKNFSASGTAYDRDTYEKVTSASLAEIQDAPGRVVNRLVGQFLRGTGTATLYVALLE